MNLIFQNDPACKERVRKIGCFVRSCGAIAELRKGKALTAEQINTLWDWAKATGNVNREDNVGRSAPIATKALRMLGDKGSFMEIGTFREGKLTIYPSVTSGLKSAPRSFIQKVTTGGTFGTHFRVVDFAGRVIFDPYNPPPEPRSIVYSVVYAYIRGQA